jgi:hypothetical protein
MKSVMKSVNDLLYFGEDLGSSSNKFCGAEGSVQVISQVANNGTGHVNAMLGLKSRRESATRIESDFGSFYVGTGAHEMGRPITNLDFERFAGSPEMRAIFYATLAKYQDTYGKFNAPLSLTVGLPLQMTMGDDAPEFKKNVKAWLKGEHNFAADGKSQRVEIAKVNITSQPVGALHRYTLEANGEINMSRKEAFEQEVGIISPGFNTLELLVVKEQRAFERFTAGNTVGVRRLLELLDPKEMYSPAERDEKLRRGDFKHELKAAFPIWEEEIRGEINKKWDKYHQRFHKILIVGGGSILLKDLFARMFGAKAWISDNPVIATAEGLYRLAISK